LTKRAWQTISSLLPRSGRGRQWRNYRVVINGIVWKLRTGAPWRDLPNRSGLWQTCYDRFIRWRQGGTWDRLLAQVQTTTDAVEAVNWEVSIDSTVIRAHQHASGTRRRPSQTDQKRESSIRRTRPSDGVEVA
jgi:transposase